ncbi:helix-turn-helix transcriptional regulator [Methylobacterium oryzisoli]|uniref:helix-turn-helix transcriptional regulator n=1 Tax=Methylobacterium oryzisoli TaxID=3385502 RepID=UPI003891637F
MGRIAAVGARSEGAVADRTGDVLLLATAYPAREGDYLPSSYTWLHLCRGGGGRLRRFSSAQRLDGAFRPGMIGLAAPIAGGDGFWPAMRLLSLGLSARRLARLAAQRDPPEPLPLAALASRFHTDPLLPPLLAEMLRSAGEHGLSAAFFDHAVGVVMHRLCHLAAAPPPQAGALTPRQVRLVRDAVEARLDADLGVTELGALVGLSPSHFSRSFRAATGVPPYAFVTARRMERAAQLLDEGVLTVTDVAVLVGYANPSQFAAAFRRHTGQTPARRRAERP